MFIVWRGFGLAVAPIGVATIVVANVASSTLPSFGLTPIWSERVAWSVSTLAGAAVIWALAMHMAGKPRQRVHPKTGQAFVARDHAYAGHLGYLPARFWAFVILLLGATMVVAPKLLG